MATLKTIADSKADLTEAYQDISTRFAFLKKTDEGFRMRHVFVKCRDYLNELVIGTLLNKDMDRIYGFTADMKEDPLDMDEMYMAVKSSTFTDLKKGLVLLNEFERRCGLEETVFVTADTPKSVKILKADPAWQSGTVPISLYTHILRALTKFGGEEAATLEELLDSIQTGNVHKYQLSIRKSKLNLELLVRNMEEMSAKALEAYDGLSISEVHNRTGIITMAETLSFQKVGSANRAIQKWIGLYEELTHANLT